MPLALHYTRQGKGPPLLILHGLYGAGTNWGAQARGLAQSFDVILPDLRNHGRSPHDPDMSYPAMAADVAALMDSLGIASALVLGHSMGGKAAMTLALTQPERVRALIAADIAPVPYRHDHTEILEALRAMPLDLPSREAADQWLEPRIASRGVRQFLLTNLQRDGARYAWRLPLAILADQLPLIEGFPPLEARNGGPALFLHGENSDYVTPATLPAIRRYFPRAEIAAVPGAGHWLHVDQPGAFAEKLRAYLKRFESE